MSLECGPPLLRTREPLGKPPRQARSVERRKQLLNAARLLFAEKGFEGTSIAQITAKAGTAAGAFYIYFRSKKQLLVALMNELLEGLSRLDPRPQGGDVRQGLRTFLAAAFRTDFEYYGVVRAWREASLTDVELGRLELAVQSWTEARVRRVFERLQNAPGARKDGDVPAFARMMDRHFWSLLARGPSLTGEDFDREINLAADVIYRYLFRDDPGKGRRW